MTTLDIDLDCAAFAPFMEPLLWYHNRKPYDKQVVHGAVFHGRKQIDAHQSVSGVVKKYSDTWTVVFPISEARVHEFIKADTLVRQSRQNETLIVESVTKNDNEWIVSVTSDTKYMSY